MNSSNFSSQIIKWYYKNKRDLPWRNTSEPYIIWLSEIILQQTRVEQGLPYFHTFIQNYPNVFDLAKASEQEVLRDWQGLGYYSRARNLHFTAKQIAFEREGRFPDSFVELKKLKGVGTYTAAAIASFSFNEAVPVVDGNVMRVLSRVFALDWDISESKTQAKFFECAQNLLPKSDPATFNQAIMEFGALFCTPKTPNCVNCTFNDNCEALALKKVQQFPVKTRKQKKKDIYFYYLIFEHKKKILLRERQQGSIWQGLNEFLLLEYERAKSEEVVLEEVNNITKKSFEVENYSKEYIHILSHRKIHAFFIRLCVDKKTFYDISSRNDLKAYTIEELENIPKPVLIVNYLDSLYKKPQKK